MPAVALFDHRVGAHQKRLRDHEAESLGGPKIDDDLEFRWMLHGQIGGFGAPEYFIDISCPLPELISRIPLPRRREAR
jgi:hypothetical protein